MVRSNRSFVGAAARKSHASHTPCEHPELAFAWCVRGARLASRCGGRRSIRPRHCARFQKPCTMMRLKRPSVVAAARRLRAFHAN
eukprot:8292068-Lingulodinium_polyedra.AAC.1